MQPDIAKVGAVNPFLTVSIYYHRNGGMTVRYLSIIADRLQSRFCPRADFDMLDIPTDPEKTIQTVTFDYVCNLRRRAFVWLCADTLITDIHSLSECPCSWELNREVTNLTLISTMRLDADCVQTSVVYTEAEDWTAVAPKESDPLPAEPAEIGIITFEAKTDAKTASQLTLLIEGKSIVSDEINETAKTETWETGASVSVKAVSLTNTGSSTVYIRNLTTE